MNLSRCENGHFYDKEKYAVCPHCSNGAGMNDSRTFAFDATEEVAAAPAPQPVHMEDNLPISGMEANDLTMPGVGLGGGYPNYVDTPTVPLENIFEDEPTAPAVPEVNMPTSSVVDEDDDHTIGFFDPDFFGTPAPSKPVAEKAAPAAKAPIVSKVSTPCVGWLIAIGGKHIGTDFRLKVGKNYVGRNASNDIALPEDMSVSREKHATVVYEPKNHLYFVQPGESSSLVYKNDELVLTPMLLKAYDIITIGEINLMFMPLCGENFNWTALFEEMKRK